MAGRVERRINDKFYFVLDEVGNSSDSEPEVIYEVNSKVNIGSNLKSIDPTRRNAVNKPSSKSFTETKNENLNAKDTTKSLFYEGVGQDSICSSKSEDKEVLLHNYEPPSKKIYSPNAGFAETSAVVDMEIDSDVDCEESINKPLVKVTFRDEGIEEYLKDSLFKFFSQKIKSCTIVTNSENNLELEIYDKDPKNPLGDELIDFDLDTTPGDHHSDVPSYGRAHDFLLSDQIEEKPETEKLHAPVASCFNCLGNHNLKDCPEVKNFKVINQNRLKFQVQNKSSKCSRYHSGESQKFGHIMPGAISKKLRNALNLHKNQQPGFIYRMRLLGYPPAWLEEAKISHSGVTIYDNTGVPVLEEDEEEGEIVSEGSKDRFDLTKIIDFPGFNVPLPNNFKDEGNIYSCPALSENQSKENLIRLLQPKTVQAYVKKSLTSKTPDEKLLISDSESQQSVKRVLSPTIEEMEEKKRQLLMELNGEESAFDLKQNSEDSSSCPGMSEPETVQNTSIKEPGVVKKLEFGTPILKSVSPFSKLPSREQFSVNVSDVINFENLPNSTGKYETMRHVLTKIRVSTSKTLSEL